MLQYLKIKNLALMDEVELNFDRGFTAVTGETGAGKSILLGALALLSGSRVDKTIIRKDAEVCEVEGGLYFADTQRLDSQLETFGLPPCEDGSLILRRSIARSKMP
jgi:DNA repair protein RecN (Recombination protein N)